MDGPKPGLSAKTFKCLKCGAPIRLRGLLQTASVVCGSCGTIIDISDDENLKIISQFVSRKKYEPAIPLGSRGTFPDGVFEAIGFMQRVVKVEDVDYFWREYLLFNPYKGFRWLSEYDGHWNYIKTILQRPQVQSRTAYFNGTAFRHFQSAYATVDYVAGEFYWRIAAGEGCTVADYIAPPQMLSMEETENEITWSIGQYMEPDAIRNAFKLKTLPPRIGVGADQPAPGGNRTLVMFKRALVFIAIAMVIQLASLALSQNRLVYEGNFAYMTGDSEKSRVTDSFELTGRPSNVMVRTLTNLENNWLYLNMALINEDTGTAYDFGREIEYYHGYDSDGSWSEGSKSDSAVLPRVPSGRYFLRLEPEGEMTMPYTIRVYRDVPQWWPFFILVGIFLFMPLVAFWKERKFEYQRWSESDHPWGNK